MENLRPLERRIVAMSEAGVGTEEIGRRFRRSPAHVERILGWATIPRPTPPRRRWPKALERRVLALRAAGETHEEVADRFKRSPGFIRQVEGLAHYRLGRDLLRAHRRGEA